MNYFKKPLHVPRHKTSREVVVAAPCDALVIRDIHRECFDDECDITVDEYAAMAERQDALLVRHGSAVLGVAISQRRGMNVYLCSIAVRPKYRRQGVGRLLVEGVAKRKPWKVVAEVHEGEPTWVMHFFARCGFASRVGRDRHGRRSPYYVFTREPQPDPCEIGGGR